MYEVIKKPGLAVRLGVLKERDEDPKGIAIHTTGSGPWARIHHPKYARWRAEHPEIKTTFDAAAFIYRRISKHHPHMLIGQRGERMELAPAHLKAQHIGSAKSMAYRGKRWRQECQWWLEMHPELTSPRDFLGGQLWVKGSANDLTWAIDVAPPEDDPRAPWSDACKEAVALTVNERCAMHRIPCTRNYVGSHSSYHPLARTTAKGNPWDPGPRQWGGFDDWLSELCGAPW